MKPVEPPAIVAPPSPTQLPSSSPRSIRIASSASRISSQRVCHSSRRWLRSPTSRFTVPAAMRFPCSVCSSKMRIEMSSFAVNRWAFLSASLHEEFVRRTLQTVWTLRGEAELELCLDALCTSWSEFAVPRSLQHEGDLGMRIYAALERGLSAAPPHPLTLRNDSPPPPPPYLPSLLS